LWLAAGVCALAAGLLYVPTLRYGLVWDDVDIVIQNRLSPWDAFGHSFWHGGTTEFLGRDPFYRPLVNFTLGIDEAVAGHKAWYFHLVNLLLHAVFVVLAVLTLFRLTRGTGAAAAGGLLLALHPALSDSVAYVSGRTDILCGIGLAVGALGLARLVERCDWPAVVLLWLGFAVGVLAKETAVLFVLVAPVWLLTARSGRRLHSRDWAAAVGLAVLLAGYLCARALVLGGVLTMSPGAGARSHVLLALNGFGRSLIMSILPFAARTFAWDGAFLAGPTLWLVPALAFLALPFALRPMHGSRQAALGWLWSLLFLLPGAGLAGFGPQGRLLYVPGFGLVLLAVTGGRWLARRWPRTRRALAAGLALSCMVMAFLALARMRVWRDSFTLFSRVTREAPGYAAGHFNLAAEFRARGDVKSAIAAYRRAIALDSTAVLAYSNLGAVLQSTGELGEAERLYRKTVQMRPDYPLAWNNLGIVLYKRGDVPGAVAALRRATELARGDAGAVYNLGRIYQQATMPDSARACFDRAFKLDSLNPHIRASYEQAHPVKP
jgi:tetratricopeptide (TPR) repeat protein